MLAAGKLGGLAEEHRGPLVHQHIHRRTHARARPEPRRRVGLATLDADREVLQLHRLAPQLRGPLHEFLGLPRGPTYGLQIPATLFVQFSSIPMTTAAATLGLLPVPIMVRK